jgi:hypothetical protein
MAGPDPVAAIDRRRFAVPADLTRDASSTRSSVSPRTGRARKVW